MAHKDDTTDTTQAQALDIEVMKADMQAGTLGPWQSQPDICHFYTVSDVIGGAHNQKKIPPQALHINVGGFNDWESKEADTRRIARVPEMEARIIRDQAVIAAADGCANWCDALIEMVQSTSCNPDDARAFDEVLMGAQTFLLAYRAARKEAGE